MKNLFLSSCLALGLTSALFAEPLTFSSVNGGAATGSPKLNLDNLLLGNASQWVVPGMLQVSFDGDGGVVNGAASGLYAAPFVSGSNGAGFDNLEVDSVDTTNYLSSGIGSIIFNFNSSQNYFGLLWGSVDNYNTLSFYNGGSLVGSITGTQVWDNANGNQGQQGTFYVNVNSTIAFNKVVANSTQYAFELDNVAYNANGVPDTGATLALLGLSLASLACFRRKA